MLLPFASLGQFFLPTVEPMAGINYYNSIETHEYSEEYAGVSVYYGMRWGCFIGNRVLLSIGVGLKQYPYDLDYFMNSSIKGYVYRDYLTGFSVFCEIGGEVSEWGGLTLPFYLGTNQYITESVSFNFRVRLPTFLDVKYMETAGHVEIGMEAGIQFDLTGLKRKKITRIGNPFILM